MSVPDFGGGIQPVHVWYSLMVVATALCGFLWRISLRLKKTNDILVKFLIEHEILIDDYCVRESAKQGKTIRPEDLPTRKKGLLGAR